jgi:hypothetical protein
MLKQSLYNSTPLLFASNQPQSPAMMSSVSSLNTTVRNLTTKLNTFIENYQICDDERYESLKCAINKNTDKLEDLSCAIGGGCDDLKRELMRYEKLYATVFDTINTYLNYFRDGDFAALKDEFSSELYVTLGQILVNDEAFADDCLESVKCYVYDKLTFSKFKGNAHKILDGLEKGILQEQERQNCCEKADHLHGILYDREKLVEFIESYYNSFVLLETQTQLEREPAIKPQYIRYIQEHGVPPGGVFESEKMSTIIKQLIVEGVLEEIDLANFHGTCDEDDEACHVLSDCEDHAHEDDPAAPCDTTETPCEQTETPCDTTCDTTENPYTENLRNIVLVQEELESSNTSGVSDADDEVSSLDHSYGDTASISSLFDDFDDTSSATGSTLSDPGNTTDTE